jgi:hypothetical protein
MACHLSALAGLIIPFGSILIPLIIWLTQKDKHPFINEQGKESVNFQISMIIYGFVFGLITAILSIFLVLSYSSAYSSGVNSLNLLFLSLSYLVLFIWILVLIFQLFVIIIASVRAYNGQSYHYPFNLRLLK